MEEHISNGSQNELSTFIEEINTQLDEDAASNANRAFNLGCMIGLIPAAILVLLTFFISNGGWIPVALTAVLMFIALMLFANLAAYTARNRTMDRVYQNDIVPKINAKIDELNIEQSDFEYEAVQTLPAGSSLLKYCSISNINEEMPVENSTSDPEGADTD